MSHVIVMRDLPSTKAMNKYKGHSYTTIKDTATGKWRASLVVPLRPAKFAKEDFNSRGAAESWIKGVINSLS